MSTDSGLTAGTIDSWYLDDAAIVLESQQNDGAPDADGNVPTAHWADRVVITITVSRVCTAPSDFSGDVDKAKVTSLPTIYSVGDHVTTIAFAGLIGFGGSEFYVREDRLVRDDQRVGAYRNVRKYEFVGPWAARPE